MRNDLLHLNSAPQILTTPDTLQSVAEALSKDPSVHSIKNMSFIYKPLSPTEPSGKKGQEDSAAEFYESAGKLVAALEDDGDTVAVFTTIG